MSSPSEGTRDTLLDGVCTEAGGGGNNFPSSFKWSGLCEGDGRLEGEGVVRREGGKGGRSLMDGCWCVEERCEECFEGGELLLNSLEWVIAGVVFDEDDTSLDLKFDPILPPFESSNKSE